MSSGSMHIIWMLSAHQGRCVDDVWMTNIVRDRRGPIFQVILGFSHHMVGNDSTLLTDDITDDITITS